MTAESINPYEKWDEVSQNPYAATLASGTATLSSTFVVEKYPEISAEFKEWEEEEKVFEPLGRKSERVVLLYPAIANKVKNDVAEFVGSCGFHVLTAPFIYEKNRGRRIAFQPYEKENLNDFIKRMIYSSRFAIVLYSAKQGGQIIETSWCSDSLKPTLGLVHFTVGDEEPNGDEMICPYLKHENGPHFCTCNKEVEFKGCYGGYICSRGNVFCNFTQQEITKMVFDFYIMNPRMHLFGAWEPSVLHSTINHFLIENGFKP